MMFAWVLRFHARHRRGVTVFTWVAPVGALGLIIWLIFWKTQDSYTATDALRRAHDVDERLNRHAEKIDVNSAKIDTNTVRIGRLERFHPDSLSVKDEP